MRGDGIVNQSIHAPGGESGAEAFAVAGSNDVQVPCVMGSLWSPRQADGEFGERLVIARREPCSSGVPFVETTELRSEHCRLDLIEPAVEAYHFVHVFLARSVVAQDAQSVGDVIVIGGHPAAVAERAEILAGVEAPCRGRAECARSNTVKRGA